MTTQTHEHEQAGTATSERRSETRFKAGHSVVVKTSHAHPMEAYLIDVSSRGARVRVPMPVPVSAQVRIESQGLLLFGTITHCELTHGAYEAGIALALPVEMLGELEKLNAAISAECEL